VTGHARRWTTIAAAVAVVALVAGAAIALAGRPHTGRLRTPSPGMAPALPVNTIVTADYDAYRHAPPRIGDIVVAHPPAGVDAGGGCAEHPPGHRMCALAVARRSDALFIKRVVAGPGDRVALRGGRVIRNGRPAAEPYVVKRCTEQCDFSDPIVVPAGQYVLLGDNRGASDDSRFWGPVRRAWIVARVDRCNALGFQCRPR
jgi:signal peptidase I